MTLYNIVSILKSIAASQPNIRTTTDGSVYDALNTNPAIQYDVFHISQTNHREDENYDYYGFNLFYISRLEDSLEDNRLQIQSIGKEVLSNIIRTLCANWSIDYPIITYFPFTQRFNDLCAGVYCSLQLDVPKEIWCEDDYYAEVVPGSGLKLQDIGITITENGLRVITADAEYDGIGEVRIEVDVPQSAAVLQDKEVEYTANGSYSIHPDPAYDGLSSVSVDVDVPDRYDEGYDDGKDDGEAEQKAKLTVTSFTENNTYTRENGWSAVTVNVPQTGSTINNQSKTDRISNYSVRFYYFDKPDQEKWVYEYKDNNSKVFTYDSGYTGLESLTQSMQIDAYEAIAAGENQQKAKMSVLTVTANGEYNREDGWSAITVNVPQGQGYEEGYEDGEAAQKAKMISLSVTANGQYDREDGYSAVTVNVPDRYDEGYDDGYAAGAAACSGLLASSITLNVASAITDSGTATTTFSPSTAYTDIYYTSSDTSKATIDENTGEITVIANGTVTICTRDRMSGLQDCKPVVVSKSYSGDFITAIYNVTSTTNPTKIMNKTTSFSAATLADGTNVPIATGFTFPTTGLNTVKYYISKTSLDDFLFYQCYYLVEIRMPNSITSIGAEGCFYDCFRLKTVILPNRITNLGDRTFTFCHNLTAITIPDSVKQIGIVCFGHCYSLSSVTIPSGVTSIVSGDPGSFEFCFVLPANFHNNSSLNATQNQYWGLTLYDTEQADGLCIKGNKAVNCRPSISATTVVIPNNITEISERCFDYCWSLNTIVWPSSLTVIGGVAFQACTSLTSVTIPDTVERLGEHCFNACSKLKNVTIGSGILRIEMGAFLQCSAITSMRFLATNPPILSTSTSIPPLGSPSYTYPIYVPSMTAPYYKAATGWSPYADRVQS